jgi:hypothetical protein
LRAVLDGLLANVELGTDGAPGMSGQIADPRFTIPLSGWYWQVSPPRTRPWASSPPNRPSKNAWLPPMPICKPAIAEVVANFYIKDSGGKQLRAIEQKFKLFGGDDEFSPFLWPAILMN